MALLRRRRVPETVRQVALPPGARRAGWALTADGAPLVATDLALLLPDGTQLPWTRVERAGWAPPELSVRESAEVEGTGRVHVLRLADAGDLPDVVRTRVTGSVAWSRHERLAPQGGVRLVGRRVPGAPELDWQLVYDRGTDLADPLVRAQAEQLLESARRSIG